MNTPTQGNEWAGVIHDLPDTIYHHRALDIAGSTGLKQILRSPAHFRHYIENPEDEQETAEKNFGKAFHCAILEPDHFHSRYSVLPSDAPRRPTAAQWNAKKPSPDSMAAMDWWRGWQEKNAGKQVLPSADYDRALRMGDSARAHPVAAGLLIGGLREMTLRWEETHDGQRIRCQARPDLYLPNEFIMDAKSCRDASEEGFARAVHSYLYDLQEAHYLEGVRAHGDSIRYFVFLAVESSAPYVCQPYLLDANAEQRGATLRSRAIRRQAECLKNNRWPGYSDKLGEIHLPAYAYYGLEEENA